jgi:hypothetical protein
MMDGNSSLCAGKLVGAPHILSAQKRCAMTKSSKNAADDGMGNKL